MTAPDDLVALLGGHAAGQGERTALRFLRRGETVEDEATYGSLDRTARIVAGNLLAEGLAGRPVLVAVPQGLDFVRMFLGCLYAGVIAVPTPALGDPRGAERVAAITRHARPAAILAPAARHETGAWTALADVAPALRFLPVEDLLSGEPAARLPAHTPRDIAFLQYTSGSTSRPKGVAITRGNIAANLAMIEAAFGQSAASSTVSWLPLHHDMGLIGCVLEPLRLGASATLMSPLSFLQRPMRWLRAIDRYGATTAGAPNFAYDLCVRAIEPDDARTLDLSRWDLAFCGSEPVRAGTLARFANRFAPGGFAARAFYPCYGQAEATLFVTGGEPGGGVRTAAISRAAGEAIPVVSCGRPRLGTGVAVIEPGEARRVGEGDVGEIAVAGEAVSPGFWNADGRVEPDPQRELTLDGRRFLRTGDLGTVREGELYILGRARNMIIVRGVNIHAEDVEETALAHPAAAAFGAVAAVSVLDGDEADDEPEGIVLVCELAHRADPPDAEALPAIARSIAERHGVLPRDLLVVPCGAIERTVSGKLRRADTRRHLGDGSLTVLLRHAPARFGKTQSSTRGLT